MFHAEYEQMPVRPVKVGETRVDDRGRLVIPADLRKVLGLASGEKLEIYRLEGALDIFGEALYIGVPTSRDDGLLLLSYAPVDKEHVVSVMETWWMHYQQIKSLLGASQKTDAAAKNPMR
jgi:AbrB family looped-hinge helix DNA binding protein